MAAIMEILSKEIIKPSSPTPHHLKNYKLSLLDQLAPPVYIPLIFIWRHFIDQVNPDDEKSFAAIHAVNLRPRMSPSLPEHAFGNMSCPTIALSTPDANKGYHNLVGRLRTSIRNINSNYVKKMLERGDEFLNFLKQVVEVYSSKDIEFCGFSSWCRFPFYEANYGWGKPVWVCTTALPLQNSVFLMSTSCGEGIEAWVNIVEDDVPKIKIDLLKAPVT